MYNLRVRSIVFNSWQHVVGGIQGWEKTQSTSLSRHTITKSSESLGTNQVDVLIAWKPWISVGRVSRK